MTIQTDDSPGATEVIEETGTETGEENENLQEEVYYEIDGEEVSLATIQQWKTGHMKDADYTQKTQKLSERSKALDAKDSEVKDRLDLLDSLEAEITNLALGELANVKLDDLVDDPEKYTKTKHELEKRSKSLDALKSKYAGIKEKVIADNQKKLSESLGWADTAKQKSDLEAISNYVKGSSITEAEFVRIDSPGVFEAILKAEKYDKLVAEKPEILKKVKTAPKITKPGASEAGKPKSLAERMYGQKQT